MLEIKDLLYAHNTWESLSQKTSRENVNLVRLTSPDVNWTVTADFGPISADSFACRFIDTLKKILS